MVNALSNVLYSYIMVTHNPSLPNVSSKFIHIYPFMRHRADWSLDRKKKSNIASGYRARKMKFAYFNSKLLYNFFYWQDLLLLWLVAIIMTYLKYALWFEKKNFGFLFPSLLAIDGDLHITFPRNVICFVDIFVLTTWSILRFW